MRSLSAASAVVLGSLALSVALAVPAASAAASPQTPTQSTFAERAGALCQTYFGSVRRQDAQIAAGLPSHSSGGAQILETAELLYANASLSLGTEAQLAKLTAPAADRTLWDAMLETDRAGGLLTLETSSVLAKLVLSQNAADAAVNAYDSAYEKVEAGWNSGVKLLGITGCQ